MGNNPSSRRGQDFDPRYHSWDKDAAYKILLLGVEASGKTTILNQTRLGLQGTFDTQEREVCRQKIDHLILRGLDVIQELYDNDDIFAGEILSNSLDSWYAFKTATERFLSNNRQRGTSVDEYTRTIDSSSNLLKLVEYVSERSFRFPAYFFRNLPQVISANYLPSNSDILQASSMTTGISDARFVMNGSDVRVLDCGGTRAERKKWLNYFGSVSTLVICVPLGDYDLNFKEEKGSWECNQVEESIRIFESLVKLSWFRRSQIIILFTKIDLLEQKLHKEPLRSYFLDYIGGPDEKEVINFFFWKFVHSKAVPAGMRLEVFAIQSTNSMNVKMMIDEIIDDANSDDVPTGRTRNSMQVPPPTLNPDQLPRCRILTSGRVVVQHASVFVSGSSDALPASPSLASFFTALYSLASSRTESTDYGIYARRMALSQETLEDEPEDDALSFLTVTQSFI